MNGKLIPYSFWSFPSFPFEDPRKEISGFLQEAFSGPSGLTISEDENKVYIEAHLPGIKSDEVEMTYEKGVLWIKAEKKEETKDKKKKYYHKAVQSFSYRLTVPGDVDESKQPEAACRDGILKVSFVKKRKGQAKKITVKPG